MKKSAAPAIAGLLAVLWIGSIGASSHREAPLISQDPLADNTDLYAFVSPRNPDRVTLIANFIPFEAPYGGPNYFRPCSRQLVAVRAARMARRIAVTSASGSRISAVTLTNGTR